jgi:hypothetical protein
MNTVRIEFSLSVFMGPDFRRDDSSGVAEPKRGI